MVDLKLSCGACGSRETIQVEARSCSCGLAGHVHVPADDPKLVAWAGSHLIPRLSVTILEGEPWPDASR